MPVRLAPGARARTTKATAVGLVAAGLGVTLVPGGVRALHRNDVRSIPVNEAGFTSPVMLSWRRNDQSPFLQSVLALARRTAKEPAAHP